MQRNLPTTFPQRNPVTQHSHQREVLWQITIPLLVGAVIILVVAVLVVYASFWAGGDTSRWADVSLIWLILPALFVALVFLLLFAGLAYGVIWLIGKLPPLALKAQSFVERLSAKVRQASDAAVEPVIRVESLKASWRALWHGLF